MLAVPPLYATRPYIEDTLHSTPIALREKRMRVVVLEQGTGSHE